MDGDTLHDIIEMLSGEQINFQDELCVESLGSGLAYSVIAALHQVPQAVVMEANEILSRCEREFDVTLPRVKIIFD